MVQDKSIEELVKVLWEYHRLNHKLEKSDCILVLGTHDIKIVDYSIDLFQKGWAPFMAFSGGVIHQKPHLKIHWDLPEAEVFAQRAIERGVHPNKILIENKSTNTGENFQFIAKLLKSKNLDFDKFIIVQKPYMERRTLATGLKHWPDKKLIVKSPDVTYDEYMNKGDIPKEQIINYMVGDLQRIKIYGENGFQIHQEIPPFVWKAFLELKRLGFTSRLLKE